MHDSASSVLRLVDILLEYSRLDVEAQSAMHVAVQTLSQRRPTCDAALLCVRGIASCCKASAALSMALQELLAAEPLLLQQLTRMLDTSSAATTAIVLNVLSKLLSLSSPSRMGLWASHREHRKHMRRAAARSCSAAAAAAGIAVQLSSCGIAAAAELLFDCRTPPLAASSPVILTLPPSLKPAFLDPIIARPLLQEAVQEFLCRFAPAASQCLPAALAAAAQVIKAAPGARSSGDAATAASKAWKAVAKVLAVPSAATSGAATTPEPQSGFCSDAGTAACSSSGSGSFDNSLEMNTQHQNTQEQQDEEQEVMLCMKSRLEVQHAKARSFLSLLLPLHQQLPSLMLQEAEAAWLTHPGVTVCLLQYLLLQEVLLICSHTAVTKAARATSRPEQQPQPPNEPPMPPAAGGRHQGLSASMKSTPDQVSTEAPHSKTAGSAAPGPPNAHPLIVTPFLAALGSVSMSLAEAVFSVVASVLPFCLLLQPPAAAAGLLLELWRQVNKRLGSRGHREAVSATLSQLPVVAALLAGLVPTGLAGVRQQCRGAHLQEDGSTRSSSRQGSAEGDPACDNSDVVDTSMSSYPNARSSSSTTTTISSELPAAPVACCYVAPLGYMLTVLLERVSGDSGVAVLQDQPELLLALLQPSVPGLVELIKAMGPGHASPLPASAAATAVTPATAAADAAASSPASELGALGGQLGQRQRQQQQHDVWKEQMKEHGPSLLLPAAWLLHSYLHAACTLQVQQLDRETWAGMLGGPCASCLMIRGSSSRGLLALVSCHWVCCRTKVATWQLLRHILDFEYPCSCCSATAKAAVDGSRMPQPGAVAASEDPEAARSGSHLSCVTAGEDAADAVEAMVGLCCDVLRHLVSLNPDAPTNPGQRAVWVASVGWLCQLATGRWSGLLREQYIAGDIVAEVALLPPGSLPSVAVAACTAAVDVSLDSKACASVLGGASQRRHKPGVEQRIQVTITASAEGRFQTKLVVQDVQEGSFLAEESICAAGSSRTAAHSGGGSGSSSFATGSGGCANLACSSSRSGSSTHAGHDSPAGVAVCSAGDAPKSRSGAAVGASVCLPWGGAVRESGHQKPGLHTELQVGMAAGVPVCCLLLQQLRGAALSLTQRKLVRSASGQALWEVLEEGAAVLEDLMKAWDSSEGSWGCTAA